MINPAPTLTLPLSPALTYETERCPQAAQRILSAVLEGYGHSPKEAAKLAMLPRIQAEILTESKAAWDSRNTAENAGYLVAAFGVSAFFSAGILLLTGSNPFLVIVAKLSTLLGC